jgi:hypothetical protein
MQNPKRLKQSFQIKHKPKKRFIKNSKLNINPKEKM